MIRLVSSSYRAGSMAISLSTQSRRIVGSSPTTMTLASDFARRGYRGGANDSPPVLSPHEQTLYENAKPKSDEIFKKHVEMPKLESIPSGSLPYESDELQIRRKRLIYRSKQRGWLEVDLLLGTWANDNVPSLTDSELDEYEAFVNQETIDIYNIITLRVVDLPDQLKDNGVVQRIQQWARESPLGKADPEKYARVKTAAKLI